MRALVTGATGFIGSHLLQLLAQKDYQLFGTYLHQEGRRLPDEVELLHCDVRDRERVDRIVAETKPECIYHLAA